MIRADADLTDADAVRAVLGGQREAYTLLVRRYQDVLYAHAVRMVDSPDEAADVVQRALVIGFRRLASLSEPARVGGWLFRITANLCRDHLKSRRRNVVSLHDVHGLAGEGDGPVDEARRIEVRRRLREALGALPPEQREAFLLKHVEGRSYEEMAELLDVSVPALKMRVHRARDGLRALLEAYR